jgi:hypothetical protein
MTSSTEKESVRFANDCAGEDTLRLIANLPVPAGLEDRVKSRLGRAPHSGRILFWPAGHSSGDGWRGNSAVRAVAAAAIVFVVVGGGWGVYTRIQPATQTNVIVMPPRVNAAGGFSNSGAMRTPQTLDGPVLTHPVAEAPAQAGEKPNGATAAKKSQRTRAAQPKQPAIQSGAR